MLARFGIFVLFMIFFAVGAYFLLTTLTVCDLPRSGSDIELGFSFSRVCSVSDDARIRNTMIGMGLIISSLIVVVGGLGLVILGEIANDLYENTHTPDVRPTNRS